MNYEHPVLLDRLASEYVLGTLAGPARRRFERVLRNSPAAQAAVNEWQQRLAPLAQSLPETTVPNHVWASIEQRIDGEGSPVATTEKVRTGFGLLQAWASFASVALFALVAFVAYDQVIEQQTDSLGTQQVAFINESNAQPLWLVSLDLKTGQLTTQAVSAQAQDLDKVYELWMLPAEGSPRSLGLMPVNGESSETVFSPALLDALRSAQGLAVSIEPAGGSTTGLPTGPVVYQASLIDL